MRHHVNLMRCYSESGCSTCSGLGLEKPFHCAISYWHRARTSWVAHPHLALASVDHDRREAEHQPQKALALRPDRNSRFAEADPSCWQGFAPRPAVAENE